MVELLTAVLFVASYIFWPEQLNTLSGQSILGLWLVALVLLVALAIYDLRWMLLPNKLVFPLGLVAVAMVLLRALASETPLQVVVGAIAGLLAAGGIFYVLFQLSDGAWIGGGDVKIGFALGLMLGSALLGLLMLFIASLLGLLVSLPSLIKRGKTASSKIPFGPFLIAATIICMLFGAGMIDWYNGQFLYL